MNKDVEQVATEEAWVTLTHHSLLALQNNLLNVGMTVFRSGEQYHKFQLTRRHKQILICLFIVGRVSYVGHRRLLQCVARGRL